VIDLSTYGRRLNLTRPVVARVTRTPEHDQAKREQLVLVTEQKTEVWGAISGYRALVTTQSVDGFASQSIEGCLPVVHTARQVSHLKSGDVVVLFPKTGHVRTLFRPDSKHNALLVTERCNSYCLMCSQPPVDRDDSGLVEINLEAIRLMNPAPASLGITGGEPTLLGENLFRIFHELKLRLPDTAIHMLTNGRRFAWPDFTEAFIDVGHSRLMLGIPLYSDTASEHDYVVQARGAFDQTIQGLYQLARYDQPIEIRIVVHALTVPRLRDISEYIYRNLTFASHVAFMGLEITGFTRPNLDKLWIDPYDHQDELRAAVDYLAIRGMNASVYNHPLCLLPRELWKFARKSISDWKNIYFDICGSCGVKESCGGFFKSARLRHSSHVHPVNCTGAA